MILANFPAQGRRRHGQRAAQCVVVGVAAVFGLGCAPSCSCEGTGGSKAGEAASAASPTQVESKASTGAAPSGAVGSGPAAQQPQGVAAPASAAPSTGVVPGVTPGAAASNAAAQVAPPVAAPTDGPTETRAPQGVAAVFPDVPKGPARKRLDDVRVRLMGAVDRTVPTLSSRAQVATMLPNQVGAFSATEAVVDGATLVGPTHTLILSRKYRAADKRELYVQITDAGQAPSFRKPVIQQFGATGNDKDGYFNGRLVDGYPVIAAYIAKHKASHATALVANRYLVDVRVAPALSPLDAQNALRSLGLARLGPPDDTGKAAP